MLDISDLMVLAGLCDWTQKGPSGEVGGGRFPMPGPRQIAEPARSRRVRPRSKPTMPCGWSSVQRVSRQHVAPWRMHDFDTRAVEAARRARGGGRLRLTGVRDNPTHDRLDIGARGEDGCTLDHLAARPIRPREANQQLPDRVIGWRRLVDVVDGRRVRGVLDA